MCDWGGCLVANPGMLSPDYLFGKNLMVNGYHSGHGLQNLQCQVNSSSALGEKRMSKVM